MDYANKKKKRHNVHELLVICDYRYETRNLLKILRLESILILAGLNWKTTLLNCLLAPSYYYSILRDRRTFLS